MTDSVTPEQKTRCMAGQCTHRTRAEKRHAHGTPTEFEAAVWRAQGDGFVTADEAVVAIERYRREWSEASE